MVILSKEVIGSSLNNADLYWQLVDAGVEHGTATYISGDARLCVFRLLECRRRARRTWMCQSNDSPETRKSFSQWFHGLRRIVVLWASKNTGVRQTHACDGGSDQSDHVQDIVEIQPEKYTVSSFLMLMVNIHDV